MLLSDPAPVSDIRGLEFKISSVLVITVAPNRKSEFCSRIYSAEIIGFAISEVTIFSQLRIEKFVRTKSFH